MLCARTLASTAGLMLCGLKLVRVYGGTEVRAVVKYSQTASSGTLL